MISNTCLPFESPCASVLRFSFAGSAIFRGFHSSGNVAYIRHATLKPIGTGFLKS